MATRYKDRITILEDAELFNANLEEAQLAGSSMHRVKLRHANITAANFTDASLHHANLELTDGEDAIFNDARLFGASFRDARLPFSSFRHAKLREATFHNANLQNCDMRGADLTSAYLVGARMSQAKLQGATLDACRIYSLSAWDLELDETTVQRNLIASAPALEEQLESLVRVDDLEIAQFINLIMQHKRLRKVISAAVQRCVLLLGRFRDDRRAVLDALAACIKAHGMIPIIFDFPRPTERDLVETVTILASLSSFIVADITCPRSVPHEAEAIVPNFMIPFVPIVQEGENVFPTFQALAVAN
jgi:hypothetical protein